jgi:hypothetical protein
MERKDYFHTDNSPQPGKSVPELQVNLRLGRASVSFEVLYDSMLHEEPG